MKYGPYDCDFQNGQYTERNLYDARSEVIKAVKIQVDAFWTVEPCSVVVGYQSFGGPCCLRLHVGILPQHYMPSKPRRHRFQICMSRIIKTKE